MQRCIGTSGPLLTALHETEDHHLHQSLLSDLCEVFALAQAGAWCLVLWIVLPVMSLMISITLNQNTLCRHEMDTRTNLHIYYMLTITL